MEIALFLSLSLSHYYICFDLVLSLIIVKSHRDIDSWMLGLSCAVNVIRRRSLPSVLRLCALPAIRPRGWEVGMTIEDELRNCQPSSLSPISSIRRHRWWRRRRRRFLKYITSSVGLAPASSSLDVCVIFLKKKLKHMTKSLSYFYLYSGISARRRLLLYRKRFWVFRHHLHSQVRLLWPLVTVTPVPGLVPFDSNSLRLNSRIS